MSGGDLTGKWETSNGLFLSMLLPSSCIYESWFFKLSLISQESKLHEDTDFILIAALIPVSQRA